MADKSTNITANCRLNMRKALTSIAIELTITANLSYKVFSLNKVLMAGQ